MKLLDRVAEHIAPHIPSLQTKRLEAVNLAESLQKRRGEAEKLIDNLREAKADHRETALAFREFARELQVAKSSAEDRLVAIQELRIAEKFCLVPDVRCVEISKEIGASEAAFKERLWELELALEDRGWQREIALAGLEFSRYGVGQLIRICRNYAIKNPIIKRIAEICELYVFGRGLEIRSDDDATNQIIQAFLDANDAEMGHNGLAQKERDIQTDGSLYFGLETDRLRGTVRVIMVDPLEILDVITDPDDSAHIWYFKRQWQRMELDIKSGRQMPQSKMCWYPCLEYLQSNPPQKPAMLGGITVNWNMPILRDRAAGTGPSKWRWPVPPGYAAIDWARAYKDALEDYATVRRTLARFALMVETKGGPGAIAAYNSLFSTTFADNNTSSPERNPPPVTGAVHTSGPGNKIEAFKSAGAQANPEETRRLLLMACASAGMPETFFGDASTGSLATAVSLDRPTELKFAAIQRRWTHTIKTILRYVVPVSSGSMRNVKEAKKQGKTPQIVVKFPTVVEHAIQPMIEAIMAIGTGGGRNGIFAGIIDRRTILDLALSEIGYEDRDELLDKIFGNKYNPADDVTDQRSQVPPQSLVTPSGMAKTDLSIPPPLPPPPPPVAPVIPPTKPGIVPPAVKKPPVKITAKQKESRSVKLREAAEKGATEKSWVGGTCPVCEENADAGWIDIDEAFPSGDDEPPAHPNCDCDLETRDAED